MKPVPTHMAKPTQNSKKITEARKTFQQDGHWIIKPRKTPIEVCECGNRYIKTRAAQKLCLRCLFKK
ncbi:MAG: hypothetical protein V4474_04000 [Patescibacteria group bacterium]